MKLYLWSTDLFIQSNDQPDPVFKIASNRFKNSSMDKTSGDCNIKINLKLRFNTNLKLKIEFVSNVNLFLKIWNFK